MKRWINTFFSLAVLLVIPAFGQSDKKITDKFKVGWESIQYNKSSGLYNPDVSSNNQSSNKSETLSLSCQIEINESDLIIGTTQNGVITELKDNKGRDIALTQQSINLNQMSYEGLRYRQVYTRPPKMSRVESIIRNFLKIPPAPFTPQRIEELQPGRLDCRLNVEMLESADVKSIDMSGYFYVLMVDSIEYIDIPFEPNNTWVRLTNDVEICVIEADCIPSGSGFRFNFRIESRDLNQFNRLSNRLTVDSVLPEKIVISHLLIKQDGEPVSRSMINRIPANIGGGGSGSYSCTQGFYPIEKIRFVIAVKPGHQKIPFKLKNIPLPEIK